MSTQMRRGAAIAFACAGIVVASCAVDGDHSSLTASADGGGVSSSAAARIADLRARFQLPMPSESREGVTRRARVALPVSAKDEVTLEDETSRLSVRFVLENVHDARIQVAGGFALYAGALDGADVVQRVHAEGTEDYVVFEKRPAREELSYAVDVSRVPGLRLVSNTLEFLDETGTPLLRVAPPYVVSSGGERNEARLAVTGCAYDTNDAGPWGRKITKPGAPRCNVHVTWGGSIAYPAIVDPAWGATGSMTTRRGGSTMTLLPSGKVLITGGCENTTNCPTYLASAELYDPGSNGNLGTFAATASMSTGRYWHSASLLASGKVLVAGGKTTGGVFVASAEIYDPAGNGGAGIFASTGSMTIARQYQSASELPSGKVLIVGGCNVASCTTTLASAEVFDPAGNGGVGAFTATGSMAATRYFHTATTLPSGKVLVVGGAGAAYVASAELYDPAGAGSFAATGSMATARAFHAATLLPSGKVLVAGGYNGARLASAEVFDPAGNAGAGSFAATGSLAVARSGQAASLLPSGKVLQAAGFGTLSLASAEVYDPSGAGSFATVGNLANARANPRAVVLPSGKVLLTGGDSTASFFASAEVYGGAIGEACSTNNYCVSGFCAEGFCCNSACSAGSCDRCDLPGKEGTCSLAPSRNPGAGPACPLSLGCDGVSATCPTSCASDESCAVGFFCSPSGSCQPGKPPGAACNAQANCKTPGCGECASGFCADGVCCDTACTRTCQACTAALKQSAVADGTCGPTKDGINSRNACTPSGVLCGADGFCNGTGACRLVTPAGVSCAADGKVCDGAGSCALAAATCDGDHMAQRPDGTSLNCAPYKCNNNGTCRETCTSVSDCVAPTICNAAGACAASSDGEGEGGCAVARATASDSRSRLVWLAAGAVALLRRRRRR